ncbi:MAG: NUDIX hydrolase [Chloroflexota bacterium]
MSDTISLFSKQSEPAAGEQIFRPAVYGILIENHYALLQQDAQSGLWRPVGTILEQGQTPLQALCVRFRAVAHFSPSPGPLVYMEERRNIDADGRCWRLSHLYYLVHAQSGIVTETDGPNGDGSQQVAWLPVHELSRDQMAFGYVAIQTALRRLERD